MNDYRIRGIYLMAGFIIVGLIFTIRLFYLQVLSEEYSLASTEADLEDIALYPARGIIFDRNEKIYVKNSPIYELKFIPKYITIPDTTILEELLDMSREDIRHEIKKYFDPKEKDYNYNKRYQWQTLKKSIDKYAYNKMSEHLWQIGGVSVDVRPTREYGYPCGAHFLGFINQCNPGDIERTKDPDSVYTYASGDLIGKAGIERQYEHMLRGQKGRKTILVDALNREVGPYADGIYDVAPVPGQDLLLGVDVDLQMFGEKLMQGKKGSIVAIEPQTGEVLAFVSAPSFDPGLLTGSHLGSNYLALQQDTLLIPLLNRALAAQYPPGSIFKILQSLAALTAGVATEETHFSCPGFWPRGPSNKPGCHGAHGYCSLHNGIKYSCNPFFAELYFSFMTHNKFKDIYEAYGTWYNLMGDFGIGHPLGVDLPSEKSGNLPTAGYYDRVYNKSWGGVTIYSNAIGRGEVTMTPLQMANEAALVANRGWYITPHFLRGSRKQGEPWKMKKYDKTVISEHTGHFELVADAMEDVVLSGTAVRAQIDGIRVCGKTGTVQFKDKEDHSVFICFAPRENPQIAISVIVEHVGFGGTWAAPIASLMAEKFIRGEIKDQRKLDRILEADFIAEEAEAAKRKAAQQALQAAINNPGGQP